MDIRIVTFQRTHNCGAALQAYALSTFLKAQGHNTQILDYCPEWVEKKKVCVKNLLKNPSLKSILLYPHRKAVDAKFRKFVKNYCDFSECVHTVEGIEKMDDCNMYITGSDQVWNTKITCGAKGYLLDFHTNAKKISYAASYGSENYSNMEDIVSAVKKYASISVRERSLAEALINKGVENVKAVWDPVFLLEKEAYLKILRIPKFKNYVLIYTKYESDELRQFAYSLAEKKQLQIVDMSKFIKDGPVNHTCTNYGPLEFLGLIANAEYVITNSFHGTAFSLIFQKGFYCFDAGDRTIRIRSLLEDIGLENRLVSKEFNSNDIKSIRYENYESKIQYYIKQSKMFLLENCNEN